MWRDTMSCMHISERAQVNRVHVYRTIILQVKSTCTCIIIHLSTLLCGSHCQYNAILYMYVHVHVYTCTHNSLNVTLHWYL